MSRLVAIGFSAGGMHLAQQIVAALPAGYPLPVVLVTHLPPASDSDLPRLIQHFATLPVLAARDKAVLQAGHIYIAPADYHLLIEQTGRFALSVDAPVQSVRPSIDVFLQSAAEFYEQNLIAVVLSGANSDGAEGMARVKALGGLAIVLDPMQTEFRTMPDAVIQAADVDYVADLNEIIALLLAVGDQA